MFYFETLIGTVSFITPHCVVEHQISPLSKHDVTIPNITTTKIFSIIHIMIFSSTVNEKPKNPVTQKRINHVKPYTKLQSPSNSGAAGVLENASFKLPDLIVDPGSLGLSCTSYAGFNTFKSLTMSSISLPLSCAPFCGGRRAVYS